MKEPRFSVASGVLVLCTLLLSAFIVLSGLGGCHSASDVSCYSSAVVSAFGLGVLWCIWTSP